MIKNPKKYLERSEKERREYLEKLTYEKSAAITEAMMSSKMLLGLKFKSKRHHPRALCLTLRKGLFDKSNT
jgi:hypothetical protein